MTPRHSSSEGQKWHSNDVKKKKVVEGEITKGITIKGSSFVSRLV